MVYKKNKAIASTATDRYSVAVRARQVPGQSYYMLGGHPIRDNVRSYIGQQCPWLKSEAMNRGLTKRAG